MPRPWDVATPVDNASSTAGQVSPAGGRPWDVATEWTTGEPDPAAGEADFGTMENFGKSFVASAIYDSATSASAVAENIAKPFSDELSRLFRDVSDAAAKQGQELRETGDAGFYQFDRGVDPEAFSSSLGSGAGSLVPLFATGGGLGLAGVSSRVAGAAVTSLIGMQSFGNTYQRGRKDLERQGVPENDAASQAIVPALAQGTLDIALTKVGGAAAKRFDLFDVEDIAKSFADKSVSNGIGSLWKGVGGAVTEGAEEAASAYIGEYYIARKGFNPEITNKQALSEAWESFLVGGTLGGAIGGANSLRAKKSPQEAAQRESIRDVSPKTAEALDNKDVEAANRILPDDSNKITDLEDKPGGSEELPELPPLPKQDEAVIKAFKGKVPEWWEGFSDASRFVGPKQSDAFIEQQVLRESSPEESGKISIEYDAEFEMFSVHYDGKELSEALPGREDVLYESESEAVTAAHNLSLALAPPETKKKIKAAKKSVEAIKKKDVAKDRLSNAAKAVRAKAVISEAPEAAAANTEEKRALAAHLGIAEQELETIGHGVTSEMVNAALYGSKATTAPQVTPQVAANPAAEIVEPPVEELGTEEAEVVSAVEELRNVSEEINGLSNTPDEDIESEVEAVDEGVEENVIPISDEAPTIPGRVVAEGEPSSETITINGSDIGIVGDAGKIRAHPQLALQLDGAVQSASKSLGGLTGLAKIDVSGPVPGAGIASGVFDGVVDTIFIDPAKLAATLEANPKFSLEKAIEEELIHNADGQALRLEYDRLVEEKAIDPARVDLPQFIAKHYDAVARAMTGLERDAARKVYGNDFANDRQMAAEYVRQLVQGRHLKSITEDSYSSGAIRRLLSRLSRFLRDLTASKAVKDHVNRVDKFLKSSANVSADNSIAIKDMIDRSLAKISKAGLFSFDPNKQSESGNLYAEGFDRVQKELGRLEKMGGIPAEKRNPITGLPYQAFVDVIAKNRAIDVLRKHKEIGKNVDIDGAGEIQEDAPETRVAPGSIAGLVDLIKSIDPDKLNLTEAEAETFVFALSSGFGKQTDVAAALGKTPATVNKQLKNAAYKISQAVQDGDAADPVIGELMERMADAGLRRNLVAAADPLAVGVESRTSKALRGLLKRLPVSSTSIKGAFDSERGLNIDSLLGGGVAELYPELTKKDGYINSRMSEVAQESARLKAAVESNYGKTPTEAQQQTIIEAFAGSLADKKLLPDDIAESIGAMRSQIDALSGHIVDQGWVDDGLKESIEGNIGKYLSRSYRIFDEGKKFVAEQKHIDAAELVVAKHLVEKRGMSKEQAKVNAEAEVQDLLAEYKKDGSIDTFQRGKVGQKDLSVFRKRKDIAPEIRALMGEYTDPVMNYTRTASRLLHFVANHKFLEDIREIGLEKGIFFEKSDTAKRNAAGAHSEIKGNAPSSVRGKNKGKKGKRGKRAETAGTYTPLAGLYTSPEVVEVLEAHNRMTSEAQHGVWTGLMKWHSYSKFSKTVLSGMTNVRNIMGQPGFWLANGYGYGGLANIKKGVKGSKRAFRGILSDAMNGKKEFQAYYNKMVQLGLAKDDITSTELRRALNDFKEASDIEDTPQELFDHAQGAWAKGKRNLTKARDATIRFYQGADELGKIVAWEMEVEMLKDIHPDMSQAEVEVEAAERIRNTFPTYSKLPPLVQFIRTQPFVGPFIAFTYETLRTQYWNMKYAKQEMAAGNTAYGARRIAGLLSANVIGFGIQEAMKSLSGVSDEEEENVRSLFPDYEKDAQFAFWRGDDGELKYANISYNNPYSLTADTGLAMLGLSGSREADGLAEHLANKVGSLLSGILPESIVSQAMLDVGRNSDRYGRPVYKEHGDPTSIATDVFGHLFKTVVPGTLDRAYRRWEPAYNGETLRSGEKPSILNELGSELTGIKVKTLNYGEALSRAAYGSQAGLREAQQIFNEKARSKGTVSEAEIIDAYQEANRTRFKTFRRMARQVRAAQIGGLSNSEILRSMKAAKVTLQDAKAVIRGIYTPLKPSADTIKEAKRNGHPIPMDIIKKESRAYADQELRPSNR